MSTTLTIRTSKALRKALEEQARARQRTASQLAREILTAALTERPFSERTGHLRGQLALETAPSDPWRREIESRNRRR